MNHESCQNSVRSMKHCGLPPHPPLQINRKVRKGSKENRTHDHIKASEKMKTPDENHPRDNKSFTTSFLDLKTTMIVIKLNIVRLDHFVSLDHDYTTQ